MSTSSVWQGMNLNKSRQETRSTCKIERMIDVNYEAEHYTVASEQAPKGQLLINLQDQWKLKGAAIFPYFFKDLILKDRCSSSTNF